MNAGARDSLFPKASEQMNNILPLPLIDTDAYLDATPIRVHAELTMIGKRKIKALRELTPFLGRRGGGQRMRLLMDSGWGMS